MRCYKTLLYVDGIIYCGSSPLQLLNTVLHNNYFKIITLKESSLSLLHPLILSEDE